MPSMKQQREINDLKDRVQSLEMAVDTLTVPKKKKAKKASKTKKAANGSL